MENEKTHVAPSYVGPLARAEDSADRFISGIVYCGLLEKLLEQQKMVNELLSGAASRADKLEAVETDRGLEQVWLSMAETFGIES